MKKINTSLILASGFILILMSAIQMLALLLIINFISAQSSMPQLMLPFLEKFGEYVKHPGNFIILILMLIIGILLIITSHKIRHLEHSVSWPMVSLILGFIIIFELRGAGLFGGFTAGILSLIGSGGQLYITGKAAKN